MPARLWKKAEREAASRLELNRGPPFVVHDTVPDLCPQSLSQLKGPRRRRRIEVAGLYAEAEPEARRHARALLRLVQTEYPTPSLNMSRMLTSSRPITRFAAKNIGVPGTGH